MHIRKATKHDLIEASKNLCKGDFEEFHMHTANRDPREVLPECLDETTHAIVLGSLVLAVGGSKDCLWFVTTSVVDHLTKAQRITFYRLLKGHLDDVKDRVAFSKQLTNYVSVQNTAHIRLLDSLGASWSSLMFMSPAGFAFRQFWL
jgi:hypothetical protein